MIAEASSEAEITSRIGTTTKEPSLLRFTTAGSVDDGKSTLIGRLLYDTKAVYEDQLASIAKTGINRSDGPIDLSLITDGLRAEREQGITIDVAYRYFSTPRRSFILADTPGHEEYTRNMVTGASTAHAAIVLLDASKGLLPQSRRHTYIAGLLGIRHVIAAVNKMDLVDYRKEAFVEIAGEFLDLAKRMGILHASATPVSALKGDNIVSLSPRMPWYAGPTLLEYLENVPVEAPEATGPLRLPVQYVIRPDSRFRGLAGRIASGTLHQGAAVTVLPSGIRSRVRSITTFEGEREEAGYGTSVTLTLEDEIDVGRGDLLAGQVDLPATSAALTSDLVWMSPDASSRRDFYLLKQATRTVRARLEKILYRVDVNTLDHIPVSVLEMNDVARLNIETTLPLVFDPYRKNRTTGSFILIDPLTNATVAGGMIVGGAIPSVSSSASSLEFGSHGKTVPAAFWIVGRQSVAEGLRRAAEDEEGWRVELLSGEEYSPAQLTAVAAVLRRLGVIAIMHVPQDVPELKPAIVSLFGDTATFQADLPRDDNAAIAIALKWLRELNEKGRP